MSENKKIQVRDLGLFLDAVKSAMKIVESAKFEISQSGVEVYGCNEIPARCEITTNALWSTDSISFSIADLNKFSKILQTVNDVHNDGLGDLQIELQNPFIKFSSKRMKTKINLIDDDTISKWLSKKVTTQLAPVFEFKTTPELLKRINSHSFVVGDNAKDLRIVLSTESDMENNTVFATLKNIDSELSNSMMLKAGLVTLGAIPTDKRFVIDIDRLNLFNVLQSPEIQISLMDKNVLVSKAQLSGKDGSWLKISTLCSMLKG